MSKKKPKPEPKSEHYEYIKAIRDAEGNLRLEYKVAGARVAGRMDHDEDVSDFSNPEVEALARGLLTVEDDDPVKIEICEE